ncbi:MAG: shikimate dehydrogenase [Syntrophales bacterium]|nr:shikimate dehydrogenase [Syntrophales bacterium]PKN60431.1 MAG: shikimate dehydrogenase [Deltaproteobacteria bacterium HGW-Deltaproteobacteria-11]
MIYALFGNPVAQSLSPLMHNAALKEMGLPGCYVPLCVRHLPGAVQGLRGMDIRGVSVTIPFKSEIMEYLDDLDDEALRIGAVNTVVNDNGRLTGHNTDWRGLIQSLKEQVEMEGKTVIILGAGGTARAALYGVVREGGHPVIVNRTEGKGRELAQDWGCPYESLKNIGKIKADILINTTPVGMFPHIDEKPVEDSFLTRYALVVDVIYNPLQTSLLKAAETAGCRTLSGLDMFVYQGAQQIRLWTGQEPPRALMRQVVLEHLTSASGIPRPV